MKIIYSLPEYLRLVVSFNSETQLGMQAAEPVLEEFENILFHNQLPDWNGNEALRISIDAETCTAPLPRAWRRSRDAYVFGEHSS